MSSRGNEGRTGRSRSTPPYSTVSIYYKYIIMCALLRYVVDILLSTRNFEFILLCISPRRSRCLRANRDAFISGRVLPKTAGEYIFRELRYTSGVIVPFKVDIQNTLWYTSKYFFTL